MSILRTVFLLLAVSAEMATAESKTYGNFQYHPDLPGVLFLTGEIMAGDSFELRRAMRDQPIELVITASPGGNLYEGLQIASILHDNGIGTYLPEGANCESSCANIFLGGRQRLLAGNLGVHQFYSGAPDAHATAPQSVTTAVTQYTTADIIGIMNQFDTPAFVYEEMFGTTDMHYFAGAQKAQLNKAVDDATFAERVAEADAFLAKGLVTLHHPLASAQGPSAEVSPAASAPPPPASDALIAEGVAIAMLNAFNRDWSLPNDLALPRIAAYYGPTISFYGMYLTYDEVIAEKEAFARRWPIRSYWVEEDSLHAICTSSGCVVDSIITWSAASPERGAKASGRSTWTVVLDTSGGQLRIVGEDGKTFKRR